MKLCWHKWVKQNETPRLTAYASTIGCFSPALMGISAFLAVLVTPGHAPTPINIFCKEYPIATAVFGIFMFFIFLLTVATIFCLAAACDMRPDGSFCDRKITLSTVCDRVCTKCGESRLEYTNQQLANKRAKERLELYTKTLRDIDNEP